jgi:lysozyme
MKTGDNGKQLIRDLEKLGPHYDYTNHTGRIVAYLCPKGIPTIGYGHTKGVLHTDIGVREISLPQAEGYLDADLLAAEHYLTALKLELTQNRFDALISLIYNCGSIGTTLVSQLRHRDYGAASVTMKRYIHSTGPSSEPCKGRCGNKTCSLRTFTGLITRRAAEVALFNK